MEKHFRKCILNDNEITTILHALKDRRELLYNKIETVDPDNSFVIDTIYEEINSITDLIHYFWEE